MKTKKILFGSTLLAATALNFCAASVAFADDPEAGSVKGLTGSDGSTEYGTSGTYTDGTNGGSTTIGTVEKEYKRSLNGTWTGVSITTSGKVEGYKIKITGATDADGNVTTDQDLYFVGTSTDGSDSLTITELEVENGTGNGKYYRTTHAFIVEGCTVILSGVEVDELGMSLSIGTEYQAGTGALVITNGSSVTTGAYLNTIGSNLNTGIVTIEDGSTLATQQITLGAGVDSLMAGGTTQGSYQTKCFVDDDAYATIRSILVSGESFEGSYGVVNVKSGSTFSVGVGNTDHSINKFQLSNGELNVDGAGSQMIIGSNSCFLLMGEWAFTNSSATSSEYGLYTGIVYNEKINVTNGGKITNEEGTGLYALYLGEDFIAANTTVKISVSGSDDSGNASTFDLTSNNSAHIGAVSGYDDTYKSYGDNFIIKDGGTLDVTISASEGGEFKITANGIFVCADNYETYLVSGGDEKDVGHSYGIDVKLSAESGGSLELNAENGSTVLLAAGSPLTEDEAGGETGYTNTLTITADGTSEDGETASSVTISGGDIYTNFGDAGEGAAAVSVEITATNGGTIALKAASVDDVGKGVISFGLNTKVTVENGSSLTTDGTSISFESGSSISVDATSTWKTESSVTFNAGSGIEIGAVATDAGDNDVNIAVGEVTISESASISVYVDVSALSDTTLEFTVNLMTGTFSDDFDPTAFSSTNENLFAKFSDETNWAYEYGLALDDSTLQLVVSRTYLPEPSMFGMLFGLSALGLVSTRRRRRKA